MKAHGTNFPPSNHGRIASSRKSVPHRFSDSGSSFHDSKHRNPDVSIGRSENARGTSFANGRPRAPPRRTARAPRQGTERRKKPHSSHGNPPECEASLCKRRNLGEAVRFAKEMKSPSECSRSSDAASCSSKLRFRVRTATAEIGRHERLHCVPVRTRIRRIYKRDRPTGT